MKPLKGQTFSCWKGRLFPVNLKGSEPSLILVQRTFAECSTDSIDFIQGLDSRLNGRGGETKAA